MGKIYECVKNDTPYRLSNLSELKIKAFCIYLTKILEMLSFKSRIDNCHIIKKALKKLKYVRTLRETVERLSRRLPLFARQVSYVLQLHLGLRKRENWAWA